MAHLTDALREDVQASIALFESTGRSQFAGRTFVRAFFASVEGWLNTSKEVLLKEPALYVVAPSNAEIALLREESYEVDASGNVITRAGRFIPLGHNVRMVFALIAKCFGGTYRLDVKSAGWADFQAAIKIRNRLTHPRTLADLEVSDADLSAVGKAATWFGTAVVDLQDNTWQALGGAPGYVVRARPTRSLL